MERNQALGVIEPGNLYVAEEARRRLRIGRKTWKDLRDAGLPVRYVGRTCYVWGGDLVDALRPSAEVAHA